jgi:hypothetical protein
MALLATGLLLSGCGKKADAGEKYHPAKLEDTDKKDIKKITLDAKAAERTGIETAAVTEEVVTVGGAQVTRKVVPYGALMYDKKGHTWLYTSPQPLVFVRAPIEVEDVQGNRVILTEGPPVGTAVVTVGAVELMGAEHKYGH